MTEDFQITNGSVEYTRTVRPADFEGKTPKVVLSFNIAEGSDPAMATAKVMGIAVEMVERALAARLTFKSEITVPVSQAQAEKIQQFDENGPEPVPTPPQKRTRRTKAEMEADAAGERASSAQGSVTASDTASSDLSKSNESEPTNVTSLADLGIPGEPEPELGISDKDLGAFANRLSGPINKEHGNLNKLRDVIKDFTPEGPGKGHLLSIPADQRLQFMAEAKKLVSADV